MEMTVAEISEALGISPRAVKARLSRAGIAPVRYVGGGPTALYDKSALNAIRETRSPGRPRKQEG